MNKYKILASTLLQIIFLNGVVYPIELQNDYTLYIFGWRDCPHCKDLAQYIVDKNMTFKWFWIEDEENADNLKRLANLIGENPGTPTVLVVVNGVPEAIVVGAVTEDRFWEYVINNPDEKVQVYIIQSLKSVITLPRDAINDYFSGPEAPTEEIVEYAYGPRPFYIYEYLPTIVLLLIISGVTIAFFWRRKG